MLVCDNCTLTLLDRTDELDYLLEIGSNHIDPDGIPAPWPRLQTFENDSMTLSHKLKDFHYATLNIQNFNDAIIVKVSKLPHKAVSSSKFYLFYVASSKSHENQQTDA